MKKVYFLSVMAMFSLGACKSNIEPEKADRGQADFSTYVAIGNSLTAGYADGTLYKSGQENSFPAMLAVQFKFAGGGEFKQAVLPGNYGWPDAKLVLGLSPDCKGEFSLSPVPYTGNADTSGSSENVFSKGPYNNMGIPGIRCVDIALPGYGNLNPYAGRLFQNPTIQKPIDAMVAMVPTFFTVWLGNNDILGYATNGGEGNVGGMMPTDISPVSLFKTNYESLVNRLVEHGGKGVLINIPDVSAIPYFTTIDPKSLVLSTEEAAQLSQVYQPFGISFAEGPNYFVIQDDQAPGGRRQIKEGEFLILTTPGDSLKCGGWGSTVPIPKQFVLSEDEVDNVRTATNQFNQIIENIANEHDLGLMDANLYMKTLESGLDWDGVKYSPTFVTGGTFSLDGVHLTERGYALVANELIRTINAKYKSTIPYVEINKYSGIKFP